MPLMWAHAEHVKLLRSVRDGRVFDRAEAVAQRYLADMLRGLPGPWLQPASPSRKARGSAEDWCRGRFSGPGLLGGC